MADCSRIEDEMTAALLDTIAGTVITLGDNAYQFGTDEEFSDCYEPTWGRHKARTRPAVGNHDYFTPGASGYFNKYTTNIGSLSNGHGLTTLYRM